MPSLVTRLPNGRLAEPRLTSLITFDLFPFLVLSSVGRRSDLSPVSNLRLSLGPFVL